MESAVRANKIAIDQTLIGSDQGGASPLKIRLLLKVFVFCLSTVTLSWFFEGLRECKEAANLQSVAILCGGTVGTLALIVLQGFFIYCEERSKGGRTRKIALFDHWYTNLTSVSKQKGDSKNRG